MQLRIQCALGLLVMIAASSTVAADAQTPAAAPAATPAPVSDGSSSPELAIGYTFLHSNAPPGGCGCFNLNGGNATFALPVKPGMFDLVGDVTVTHAGGISSSGYTLTLSTFTAGGRYLYPLGHSRLQAYAQALIGVAHSSGTLIPAQSPLVTSNAGATFVANLGGGANLRINRRFSLRLAEADYLVTTFDNNVNNRQNHLRISSGVVIQFGK
jgi:outer membrane immunogenic protein